MRGEYQFCVALVGVAVGSPPLARGIQRKATGYRSGTGITPACAGNTSIFCRDIYMQMDHPRLRGEYVHHHHSRRSGKGSPPLARGIPLYNCTTMFPVGITPACAGNTLQMPLMRDITKDHPRLRGEYFLPIVVFDCIVGSPPLARGIH